MLERSGATSDVAVVGWSIHVPGFDIAAFVEGSASDPGCPADRAHEILGRKGLLNKDAATRLALCAVHKALLLAPGVLRTKSPIDRRTAVVVSSNLGNISTVQSVVRILSAGGLRNVSPMDAPNASSNVIASTIAIWFGCGGPNLMVCSGATSGLDALALGSVLLRSGRADRVIVAGVEPDDPQAVEIYARGTPSGSKLKAAAGALVLRRLCDPSCGDAIATLRLPIYRHDACVGGDSIRLTHIGARAGSSTTIDVDAAIGDTYGARGVLQAALACEWFRANRSVHAVADVSCGSEEDGYRHVSLAACTDASDNLGAVDRCIRHA